MIIMITLKKVECKLRQTHRRSRAKKASDNIVGHVLQHRYPPGISKAHAHACLDHTTSSHLV
jgi:hypothetical protein